MSSGITPLTPVQETKQEGQAKKEGYLMRNAIAFDQMVNVATGGHPGETISARSARAAVEGKVWGKVMSKFLDLFQKDHGAGAMAGDLERAQTVAYLETNDGVLPTK
jgi:hypothetical protein